MNKAMRERSPHEVIRKSAGLVLIHPSAGIAAWPEIPRILLGNGYSLEEFYEHFSKSDSKLYGQSVVVAKRILALAVEQFGERVELGMFIHEHLVHRIAFHGNRWYEEGSICPSATMPLLVL
jgi:hypothetical protein